MFNRALILCLSSLFNRIFIVVINLMKYTFKCQFAQLESELEKRYAKIMK